MKKLLYETVRLRYNTDHVDIIVMGVLHDTFFHICMVRITEGVRYILQLLFHLIPDFCFVFIQRLFIQVDTYHVNVRIS